MSAASVRLVLGVVLVALTAAACAGLGPYPSAELTTMNPSWVSWFRLDWALESETGGTRRLRGYVHNSHGQEADEMQLLTQSLDATGRIIDQRITYGGNVPPLSRTYFEVRNLPVAHEYRVTIWAFSFHQGQGWF
jgi:hypothetical protein